jgi:osmotically inducible protein OsmC
MRVNPEELIGAAHAACLSMAPAHGLEEAVQNPKKMTTKAQVAIEKVGDGFKVTTITLET